MSNVYVSGTLVRSFASFSGLAGAADPGTVTLKYRIGGASSVTVVYPSAPIVKDSVGNYHADFDTSGWAGPNNLSYITQWQGTAPVQVINDDYFAVSPPPL